MDLSELVNKQINLSNTIVLSNSSAVNGSFTQTDQSINYTATSIPAVDSFLFSISDKNTNTVLCQSTLTFKTCNTTCNDCNYEDSCTQCEYNRDKYVFMENKKQCELDDDFYCNIDNFSKKKCRPCYHSCSKCIEEGNESNHKCTECKETSKYYSLNGDGTLNCNKQYNTLYK